MLFRSGEYFVSMGIPTTLREVGIGEDRLEEMANKATAHGKIGDFKPLDAQDVINIYKSAL